MTNTHPEPTDEQLLRFLAQERSFGAKVRKRINATYWGVISAGLLVGVSWLTALVLGTISTEVLVNMCWVSLGLIIPGVFIPVIAEGPLRRNELKKARECFKSLSREEVRALKLRYLFKHEPQQMVVNLINDPDEMIAQMALKHLEAEINSKAIPEIREIAMNKAYNGFQGNILELIITARQYQLRELDSAENEEGSEEVNELLNQQNALISALSLLQTELPDEYQRELSENTNTVVASARKSLSVLRRAENLKKHPSTLKQYQKLVTQTQEANSKLIKLLEVLNEFAQESKTSETVEAFKNIEMLKNVSRDIRAINTAPQVKEMGTLK